MYATTTATGNGSQVAFTISWGYIADSDVKAYVNGASATISSVVGNLVTLSSAPANGASVVIRRETDLGVNELFEKMGTPSSGGFNTTLLKVQYIAQEISDRASNSISQLGTGIWNVSGILRNVTDATASNDAVNLGQMNTALSAKQNSDTELTALAGLTSAADRVPYFTGSGTAALATFTSFARTLVSRANADSVLTDLGVSTFVKTLLDDADAATARATLGVGTGTGDVVGPVSSTTYQLAIYGSGTGKLLSGVSGLGTTGNVLVSTGGSNPPVWGQAPGTMALQDNTVPLAKLSQASANRLWGNPTGSSATASEISLGAGLAFSGSSLVHSGPFPTGFEDGTPQTITAADQLTRAHGLGRVPMFVQVWLINQTAEQGYSPGDRMLLNSDGNGGKGVSIRATSTDVIIRWSLDPDSISGVHNTTGAQVTLTNANWKAVICAA